MSLQNVDLLVLVPALATLTAAGCGGQRCEGAYCLDVATIRRSQLAIQLTPRTDGAQDVQVSVALPAPATSGACYQVPSDLEIGANGRSPSKVMIVNHGGDVPFSFSCTSEQVAELSFQVPADPGTLAITFARNGEQAAVTVTRAVASPVAVTLSATTVSRESTFSADLQPQSGALPARGCWLATFTWDGTDRVELLSASPSALDSGVRIVLGFSGIVDPPAGPGKLELRSITGDGCEPAPSASCPGVAACSASQLYGRWLGPFALTVE